MVSSLEARFFSTSSFNLLNIIGFRICFIQWTKHVLFDLHTYKQKFNHLIHNNIKSKLMPQLTAFSFSTWESVLSSPNSAKNAWVDLNLSGSRKLSRLWSSSVLFCRGVPDSRTWCSCNKHLDEFSMKAANLFLSQPFELKVHCLPYNSENSLAKLITVLYKTIK